MFLATDLAIGEKERTDTAMRAAIKNLRNDLRSMVVILKSPYMKL
jgi:hypothetical protein